jgi:hypothetical protein
MDQCRVKPLPIANYFKILKNVLQQTGSGLMGKVLRKTAANTFYRFMPTNLAEDPYVSWQGFDRAAI